MINILVDMEVLNQESPKSSDIWTHFFLLLKSEERSENASAQQIRKVIKNKSIGKSKKRQKGMLNQTVNYNDHGRLSTIFSSDNESHPFNEICFIASETFNNKIEKRNQKRNIFMKNKGVSNLIFDLRRVLICFYILSRSSIETKAKFIADLYPVIRTEFEIKDIFKTIIFVSLKAAPHFAINDLSKNEMLKH